MSLRSDVDIQKLVRNGIEAAKREEYLAALNTLSDAYSTPVDSRHADGLSYLGLCLALIEKNFSAAVDLCRRGIEMQPQSALHHVNLSRVHLAAGDRRAAVEACEEALQLFPDDADLNTLRQELGVRARPAVPFLSRENPINQALGRARHAKKQSLTNEPVLDEE